MKLEGFSHPAAAARPRSEPLSMVVNYFLLVEILVLRSRLL